MLLLIDTVRDDGEDRKLYWIVIVLGSGRSLKRCRRTRSIFFAITFEATTFRKLSRRWTQWRLERVLAPTSKSTGFDGITLVFSLEADRPLEPGIDDDSGRF